MAEWCPFTNVETVALSTHPGVQESNRTVDFGEASLRRAINQYLAHYHMELNHQGLDNRLIEPAATVGENNGKVECRERLGGMLKYYYRERDDQKIRISDLVNLS